MLGDTEPAPWSSDDGGSIRASQPFSFYREAAYVGVLPRPVEVLIEGYLEAALCAHNCIWMAVSAPGTGFCGQLCAKLLAEYIHWVGASYSDSAFPAAASSGLAQPVLPRLARNDGIERFQAVAGKRPSLRPASPKTASPSVLWNSCTIEQYVSAHDMRPVVNELTKCRDSFVQFMEEQVRRPIHTFVAIFVLLCPDDQY